jgi:phosphopantothenoylcysteine decarboxylase
MDTTSDSQYKDVEVQVVATKSSLHFFDAAALEAEHNGRVKVWTDADEWAVSPDSLPPSPRVDDRLGAQSWKKIGDPVLHIEVRLSL